MTDRVVVLGNGDARAATVNRVRKLPRGVEVIRQSGQAVIRDDVYGASVVMRVSRDKVAAELRAMADDIDRVQANGWRP